MHASENRWKAILGMSSDHAGIDRELSKFQASMYRTLARVKDPRQVRDWLHFMRSASKGWLDAYKAREGLK